MIPRNRDGPTATWLMVPLCTACHDNIHHRGWTITIDEQRTITWTAPDGTPTMYPHTPLADHDQPSLFGRDPPAA